MFRRVFSAVNRAFSALTTRFKGEEPKPQTFVTPDPRPRPVDLPTLVLSHTVSLSNDGYIPTQAARTARKRERKAVARFVRALNQGRS